MQPLGSHDIASRGAQGKFMTVSEALEQARPKLSCPHPNLPVYIEAFKNSSLEAVGYAGDGRDSIVIRLAPDDSGVKSVLKVGKPIGPERPFDRTIERGTIKTEVGPEHRWVPSNPWVPVSYHRQQEGTFGTISWGEMREFERQVMMPAQWCLRDPGLDQVARDAKGEIFLADYHAAEPYHGPVPPQEK